MLPDNATITKATREDIQFVWDNIRPYDHEELTRQDITDDNLHDSLSHGELLCGKVNGSPVCIVGHGQHEHVIYLWFFATTEINKYWKTITCFAKAYIRLIQDQNFEKRILISIWDQHRVSRRWIEHLGFRQTSFEYGPADRRFIVYEV